MITYKVLTLSKVNFFDFCSTFYANHVFIFGSSIGFKSKNIIENNNLKICQNITVYLFLEGGFQLNEVLVLGGRHGIIG